MLIELAYPEVDRHGLGMGMPANPVTLTAQQVEELSKTLSTARHNINNYLALISAAAELIKANPEMVQRMTVTLTEQPPKIGEEMRKFSTAFEQVLGITRP